MRLLRRIGHGLVVVASALWFFIDIVFLTLIRPLRDLHHAMVAGAEDADLCVCAWALRLTGRVRRSAARPRTDQAGGSSAISSRPSCRSDDGGGSGRDHETGDSRSVV
jgi:hypothetical protein